MEPLWLWSFGEEMYVPVDVVWRNITNSPNIAATEKGRKQDRLIVFLIFEEWNSAMKWISSKFQSRVWSSSSKGGHQARPEEEAATRAYIVAGREPPLPPYPTPVFPGPLLLLPMTKCCARPKQKHRKSRPVKLRPDPTACLLALERRDKRRPTIGRSPPSRLP